MKAQLALLEQQEEEDEELGEFDDSDDEGQEFNPYEHNGKISSDEENQLYTQDGEHYGWIDEDGNVVEAEDE